MTAYVHRTLKTANSQIRSPMKQVYIRLTRYGEWDASSANRAAHFDHKYS